jgi:hypothetical protein
MFLQKYLINHIKFHRSDFMFQNKFNDCYIYNENLLNYLNELMNFDERLDLNDDLQNSFIEIDKKHLPQIIKKRMFIQEERNLTEDEINKIIIQLKELEDVYKLEIKEINVNIYIKTYLSPFGNEIKKKEDDKIIIKNLELQIREKDETILLLKKEIDEIKTKSNRKEIKNIRIQSI